MYRIRTRRRDPRGERGYTLTELAVVMAVFMIFMSFAGPVMFSHLMGAIRTERRVDLQQNARAALRTMVRELRQATQIYSAFEKPNEGSGRTRISFAVDLNGDGVINDYNDDSLLLEEITYYVDPGREQLLRRRRSGRDVPLAENVTSMQFTFLGSNPLLDTDGDGVVEEAELNPFDGTGPWSSGELANVTRVQISLTVQQGDVDQTYTAETWLRNKVVG
jgi:prepilin-type N-terminal cleavage/methylation domain-containing protein